MPARRDDLAPGSARREDGFSSKRDALDSVTRRDEDDVEGHAILRRDDGFASKREDGFASKRDEDDVEGHAMLRRDDGFASKREDGFSSKRDDGFASKRDEDDVEGHAMLRDAGDGLHRGLPGSGGEFARRGPGDNPHGDR